MLSALGWSEPLCSCGCSKVVPCLCFCCYKEKFIPLLVSKLMLNKPLSTLTAGDYFFTLTNRCCLLQSFFFFFFVTRYQTVNLLFCSYCIGGTVKTQGSNQGYFGLTIHLTNVSGDDLHNLLGLPAWLKTLEKVSFQFWPDFSKSHNYTEMQWMTS